MLYEEERKDIIRICLEMQEKKYFLGTWGNVSIRVGNHIILTPSRIGYNDMTPESLVVIDLEGNIVEGTNRPTSEKEVHRQIYLRREDAGMIIHAHTKKAMAVSVRKIREVPCLVEEMSQLIGGGIPITPQYVPAEQHFQLGTAAAENIGNRNGVILRNHGPVAVGRNTEEAVLMVEVIEKACEIFLDQGQMFYAPIPQCYIDSERYRYLYKDGNENT